MEDNYKPKKEFTDHAWSEMQALLDKEMPDKGAILLVSEKGKRWGFLLLLPLLLLVSMAAFFFYYQTHLGASDIVTRGINESSSLAILPQRGDSQGGKIKTLENNNVSIAEKNQANNASITASLFESGKVKSTTQSAISKSFRKTEFSILNQQIQSSQTQNEALSVNFIDEKVSDNTDVKGLSIPFIIGAEKFYPPLEEEEVGEKEEVIEPMAIVESIDGKLLNLLEFSAKETSIDKFVSIKEAKNRLAIIASIGARNYDFSNNIDLTLGMETIFRRKGKKLGLRTGINYAQRSTTYLTREETIIIANLDEEAGEFDPAGLEIEAYYNLRAELNSNPIKYHFLEIPVLLDFKLSKKWSLHGGLSAKGLIYSSTQNFGLLNGLSNNQDEAVLAEIPENMLGEEDLNANSISYFEPQQFNLGASLGANFQATPRLGLQARFSQNLLDVYSGLSGKQRSNSVELGLNWRLR